MILLSLRFNTLPAKKPITINLSKLEATEELTTHPIAVAFSKTYELISKLTKLPTNATNIRLFTRVS